MPDRSRWHARLARTLPDAVRETAFEPSYEELLADFHRQPARRSRRLRFELGVLFVVADCHRLRIAGRFERRRAGASGGSMVIDDLRYAMRAVVRRPAFSATVALTLGVALAANALMFGIVDRLLLSGPPHVVEPGEIVRLFFDYESPNGGRMTRVRTTYRLFLDLETALGGQAPLAGFRGLPLTADVDGVAVEVQSRLVTSGYFATLGARPLLGRSLGANDAGPMGADTVAVISHAFWTRRFDRSPDVLSRSLRIGAQRLQIVGVMPRGFTGSDLQPVDLWAPYESSAAGLTPTWRTSRGTENITVFARLPRGPADPAMDQLTRVVRDVTAGSPAADATAVVMGLGLQPARFLNGVISDEARVALWAQAMSLVVLLAALSNVTNLFLTRGIQQWRELGVRLALGAGRLRLVRQLAAESSILAAAGAALGLALAYFGGTALRATLLPGVAPDVSLLDARVFGITLALGAASAWLPCLLPALRGASAGRAASLAIGRTTEPASASRLRRGLMAAQVAISLVVVTGAGLFLRSVGELRGLDLGVDTGVLFATADLSQRPYSPAETEAIWGEAQARLAALPGVASVSLGQSLPFRPQLNVPLRLVDGGPLPAVFSSDFPRYYAVTPGYFSTIGTRLLRGRDFEPSDTAASLPVVILDEAVASRLWPDADPLGRCVYLGAAPAPCRQVIGVAANARGLLSTPRGGLRFYIPLAQRLSTQSFRALFVRAAAPDDGIAERVRLAVQSVRPDMPFVTVQRIGDLAEPQLQPWKLGSTICTAFGAVALVMSAIGLYGVLAHAVAQRTRELGIRFALGAARRDIVGLVLNDGLRTAAIGVGLGALAALGAAGRFEPLLFQTRARDPWIFGASIALLLIVAFAASLTPALRAARVEPSSALRAE